MTDLETFARALRDRLRERAPLAHGDCGSALLYVAAEIEHALAAVQKPEAPVAKSKYKINRDLAGDSTFAVSYDNVWLASFRSELHAQNWARALEAQEAGK